MQKEHVNHCLTCRTKNCYHRKLGAKTSNCLEIDYAKEVRLEPSEAELINKANSATRKVFERRTKGDFTLNWLKTFLRDFFGDQATIGVASCLGSIETARTVIEAIESEGMKTTLVTCKLGGLTVKNIDKPGVPCEHPGCNPVAQAKILNGLNVPVVVLVGLCIGHDMIFIKHCKSYVIPFITKMPLTFGTL